jgi:ankyrin repeat protein
MRLLPLLIVILSTPVGAQTLDSFYEAVSQGKALEVRQFLRKNRLDLNATAAGGSCEGMTPLQCAGSTDVMKILIENGADIHLVSGGSTALDSAAAGKDNGEAARFLLQRGARPSGRTLYNALWYENTDLAVDLIGMGVDVNFRESESGYTPLIIACEHGYPLSLIKKLVEAGARADAASSAGFAVLHFFPAKRSAEHQNFDLDLTIPPGETLEKVAYLLSHGAKIEAKTNEGFTPLHFAAENSEDAAMLLIERGANIRAVSNTGETALHMAASSGSLRLAKHLLDQGLSIHAKNGRGESAIFFAAKNGNYQVIQLLVDRGAICTDFNSERSMPLHFLSALPTAEKDYEYIENHPEDFYAGLALLLKKSGPAAIHAPNAHGETPWFYLKGWMYPLPDKIRLFLNNGANRNARDPGTGLTLLQMLEKEVQENEDTLGSESRSMFEESIRLLQGR